MLIVQEPISTVRPARPSDGEGVTNEYRRPKTEDRTLKIIFGLRSSVSKQVPWRIKICKENNDNKAAIFVSVLYRFLSDDVIMAGSCHLLLWLIIFMVFGQCQTFYFPQIDIILFAHIISRNSDDFWLKMPLEIGLLRNNRIHHIDCVHHVRANRFAWDNHYI